jgi:hypothetical protein
MRTLGFSSVRVVEEGELNARYFAGRRDGFRLYGTTRMIAAHV